MKSGFFSGSSLPFLVIFVPFVVFVTSACGTEGCHKRAADPR